MGLAVPEDDAGAAIDRLTIVDVDDPPRTLERGVGGRRRWGLVAALSIGTRRRVDNDEVPMKAADATGIHTTTTIYCSSGELSSQSTTHGEGCSRSNGEAWMDVEVGRPLMSAS